MSHLNQFATLAACAAITLLTACSAPPQQAAPIAPAAPAAETKQVEAVVPTEGPVAGAPASAANTLVWVKNINDITSLDPAESYEFSGWLAVHSIYDTLVKFEGKDLTTLKPGLAEKWEIKDSGNNWELVFTLKDGVKFASGNPFTSEDVVFTFQRGIKLNKSPAFLWTDIGKLTENSISAPDAKTVVLTMPKDASPAEFLNVLTAPPLSIVDSKEVKAHAQGDDFGNTWLKDHSAGSGPYMLDHWTKDVEFLVKANPNAAVQPKMPQVLVKHADDGTVQQSLLEKGDADIAFDLTPEQIAALDGKEGITTRKEGNLQLYYIGMNAGLKPLDNNKVREALRWAIDYDAIVKDLLSGNALKVQTIIPRGLLGANDYAPYQKDVTKAKALLKEAGLENGFEIDLLTYTGGDGIVTWGDLAAKLQADWAEIGVKVNIQQQPAADLLATYRASKAPIVVLAWGPDYPDPNTNVTPFSDSNAKSIAKRNNWDDAQAIDMAKKADLETNPTKRVALYKELTEYVAQNGPYAVMFQPTRLIALRSNVQGFEWNPMSYADLWTISK